MITPVELVVVQVTTRGSPFPRDVENIAWAMHLPDLSILKGACQCGFDEISLKVTV